MSNVPQILLAPVGGAVGSLLEHYAAEMAARAAAARLCRTLWIAPNRFAVQRVQQLLLRRLPRGCFAPQVLTFQGFADRVLASSTSSVRPISRLEKRWLMRCILHHMASVGELQYLRPVAEADGLLDTVCAQISEFKRLEIWPEEVAAAANRDASGAHDANRSSDASDPDAENAAAKDRELAQIYATYQEILNRHQLYDSEGRFWSARTLLIQGQRQLIRSLELAVVHGFADFTRPQHEMLEVLAEVVGELMITLPIEDPIEGSSVPPGEGKKREPGEASPTARTDLFKKALTTLGEFRRRHPSAEIRRMATDPAEQGAIGRFRHQIFRPPGRGNDAKAEKHEPKSSARPVQASVSVWQAVSRIGEIREIARDIKARLLAGQCRAEDFLVVFRSMHDVVPLIEEVFVEYGIPVYIDGSRKLKTTAFMRSLLLLLRLRETNWAYGELLAVIRNQHIRWPELAGTDLPAEQMRVAAERWVRKLQIPAGRQVLLDRLRTIADATESAETPVARTAWQGLNGLAGFLDQVPSSGAAADWAAEVERLYDLCGAREEQQQSTGTTPDQEALHRIQRTLQGIHRLPTIHLPPSTPHQSQQESPAISFSAVLELLSDIAKGESLPSSAADAGRVRVLSAKSARGTAARHVYFAGLSEQAMPQAEDGSGYYSTRETSRLIGKGLPLVSSSQRYQEEMLLFYELISTATERLVLSYPALDEKAQPTLPSPFLAEVQRAGGEEVEVRQSLELRPVDRDAVPLSLREFRIRAVCDAVVDGSGTDRLTRFSADEGCRELSSSVCEGLRAIHMRSSRDAFSPAEGLFQSEQVRQWIASEFGPDHLWSPTALERYALCPFRFLMERVLKIESLDDLELATDYRRRGRLMHQCLAELYQKLGRLDASKAVSAQCDADVIQREMLAFLEDARRRLADGSFSGALEALDLQQIAEMAEQFYEQQQAYDYWTSGLSHPPLPAHFEVRFGPSQQEVETESEDPLSTDSPFELDLGDERVLLSGRVDRIDVGWIGQSPVFNIVDYKTGAAKSLKDTDVRAGLQLQIPLYALAVEQVLLADQEAVAWHADYWWLREDGFGNRKKEARQRPFAIHELQDGEIVETPLWRELKEGIVERVRQIVRGVRHGHFIVYSQDSECARTCPYCSVCRISQIRTLEKTWQPDATTGGEDSEANA